MILPGVMPLGRPPGVAGVALLKAAVQRRLAPLHETVRLGTRMAGSVRRQWEQFAETPDIPIGRVEAFRHRPMCRMASGLASGAQLLS